MGGGKYAPLPSLDWQWTEGKDSFGDLLDHVILVPTPNIIPPSLLPLLEPIYNLSKYPPPRTVPEPVWCLTMEQVRGLFDEDMWEYWTSVYENNNRVYELVKGRKRGYAADEVWISSLMSDFLKRLYAIEVARKAYYAFERANGVESAERVLARLKLFDDKQTSTLVERNAKELVDVSRGSQTSLPFPGIPASFDPHPIST